MECPNCGRVLTQLAEVLAQTETGTNCPHCWARLHRLAPPKPFEVVKALKKTRRVSPLRRAA